jgi:uncharacterized protein (DUF2236 family)
LEVATRVLFDLGDQSSADFLQPAGEAVVVSPDSVSWRVFKNPISLFIGGVAAVLMELSEPRVRTGIWEHTTFRIDPIRRLRRTGLAAMITIYGARSTAEAMIALGPSDAHDPNVGPNGRHHHANHGRRHHASHHLHHEVPDESRRHQHHQCRVVAKPLVVC